MEFQLSSVQTALQDSVRRFCRERYDLRSRTTVLPTSDSFSRSHWSLFADLGWLGIGLDSDVNGSEGGAVELCIVLEEFGRSLVVEPYWTCVAVAAQLVNSCGTSQQRRQLLIPLIDGKLIIAFAHSEGYEHSHVGHVETRATLNGNGDHVITGRKSLVVGGPSANKFIVSARTSSSSNGGDGTSLFVVDDGADGLVRRDYRLLDGSSACDLEMSDVHVGPDALLGRKDCGRAGIDFAMDRAMVGLCAEAVGIMDSVLWMTRDHLRTRRQFGAPLSTFQALQHRMAEMFAEVELSRSMLFRALRLLSESNDAVRHSGVLAAYIRVCQGGAFVCRSGVQLHGAMGVVEEHMIGQYFKRLTVISKLFGTIDQQLDQLSAVASG